MLTILATVLWLVSSITSHNLGRFLNSGRYSGLVSVILNRDFWYAYVTSLMCAMVALKNFVRYEPMIVKQVELDIAAGRIGA